ncbi:hypothetical protein ABK040_010668 [Willaertia magna]
MSVENFFFPDPSQKITVTHLYQISDPNHRDQTNNHDDDEDTYHDSEEIEDNDYIKISSKTKSKTIKHLKILPKNKKIIKIGELENKNLVTLDENGKIHLYETNLKKWIKILPKKSINKNQIELDNHIEEKDVENLRFTNVVIGFCNVFCFCENQEIYAFSTYNSWGQIGTGDTESYNNNNNTLLDDKIYLNKVVRKNNVEFIQVHCGYGHNYFLSKDLNLYGAGNNEFHQLCNSVENGGNSYEPILIKELKDIKIKKVISGFAYGYVLTMDNLYLTFGYNDYGQLGLEINDIKIAKPRPLQFKELDNIKDIVCGQSNTILITKDNRFFACGSNFSREWTQIVAVPTLSKDYIYLIQRNLFTIIEKDTFHFVLQNVTTIKTNELKMKQMLFQRYNYLPLVCSEYIKNYYMVFYERTVTIERNFIFKFDEKLSDVTILLNSGCYF